MQPLDTAQGYQLRCLAGDGGQAKTYLAKKDNRNYVVKIYFSHANEFKYFQRETSVMNSLESPFIARLVEYFHEGRVTIQGMTLVKPFFVMEFAQHGDLFRMVRLARFNEQASRTLFVQLIKALKHMKEKGFSHRDIKLQNILLGTNFQAKLADFGYACKSNGENNDGQLHSYQGTEMYIAPQIYEQNYKGELVDLFALGVVLFMMVIRIPPFDHTKKNIGNYQLIREGRFDQFWHLYRRVKVPDSFKRLINRLLVCDPTRRITLEQIQHEQWMLGKQLSPEQMKAYLQPIYDHLQKNDEETRQIRKRLNQNLQRFNANENLVELERIRTRDRPTRWTNQSNQLMEDLYFLDKELMNMKEVDIFGLKYVKQTPKDILLWLHEYLNFCTGNKQYFLWEEVFETTLNNFSVQLIEDNKIRTTLVFNQTDEKNDWNVQIVLEGTLVCLDKQYSIWWKAKEGCRFWGKSIICDLQQKLWLTYL